jgi:hypothetical protein
MISAEFVRANTGLKPTELHQPVELQTVLVGSHSTILFSVTMPIKIGLVNRPHYFGVADIEKYDAILVSQPSLRGVL